MNTGIPVVAIPITVALIVWAFMVAWQRAMIVSGSVRYGQRNLGNMILNIVAFLFILFCLDMVGMHSSSNPNELVAAIEVHTLWNIQFLLKCVFNPLAPITISH